MLFSIQIDDSVPIVRYPLTGFWRSSPKDGMRVEKTVISSDADIPLKILMRSAGTPCCVGRCSCRTAKRVPTRIEYIFDLLRRKISLMSTLRKVWDCRGGLPLPVADTKTAEQLIFVDNMIDDQSLRVLALYPISIRNNFTHQEY